MTYIRPLKTGLVRALEKTFNANYPVADLRDIHVSIEYPMKSQDFPSIWVDYEDAALQTAGIDHVEITDSGQKVLRWRFEGYASYTIAALSSLERDSIYDELVRILAFARQSESTNNFRKEIENNALIAMNFDFDRIESHGSSATPGTPWETDETIYERTIAMQVIGEFATTIDTGTLVPLREIRVIGREAPSTETAPVNEHTQSITVNNPPPVYDPDLTQWH